MHAVQAHLEREILGGRDRWRDACHLLSGCVQVRALDDRRPEPASVCPAAVQPRASNRDAQPTRGGACARQHRGHVRRCVAEARRGHPILAVERHAERHRLHREGGTRREGEVIEGTLVHKLDPGGVVTARTEAELPATLGSPIRQLQRRDHDLARVSHAQAIDLILDDLDCSKLRVREIGGQGGRGLQAVRVHD